MDMLAAMQVAVEVARLGSLNAAGRALRLSPASVSRIVAELEADLNVRLFNRTTRQLSLTESGQAFVDKSAALLEELDAMKGMVRERHHTVEGELRITCVAAFGSECLAPALPGFLAQHPQLRVSLDIGNRMVDLVGEHFDVAIRVGPLTDSSMIAQQIYSQRILIVAAPAFVAAHGVPTSLEHLKTLPSITQISGEWGRQHAFRLGKKIVTFDVPQNCTMTAASAVKNACLTGYGYSLLPDLMVSKEVSAGQLIRLLPEYEPLEQPIFASYASRRYTARKIRVFVDFLTQTFRTPLLSVV